MCDIDAICCIDTGASSSLVPIKLYEGIPETQRPSLDSTSSFVGADGSPIKCLGVGKFSLGPGRALIDSELIVADITDDILIGADVLQDPPVGPVIIDLVKEKITLQGLSIPIVMIDGQHRFRKVVAADFLTIPAMSEAMVDVHVDRDEDDERNKIVMIEQSPTLSEKWNLALAACLVDVAGSATVKIRLLNLCVDDVIIPPYTNMVTLSHMLVKLFHYLTQKVMTPATETELDELNYASQTFNHVKVTKESIVRKTQVVHLIVEIQRCQQFVKYQSVVMFQHMFRTYFRKQVKNMISQPKKN